jgi:hypothetical protein
MRFYLDIFHGPSSVGALFYAISVVWDFSKFPEDISYLSLKVHHKVSTTTAVYSGKGLKRRFFLILVGPYLVEVETNRSILPIVTAVSVTQVIKLPTHQHKGCTMSSGYLREFSKQIEKWR